MADWLSLLEGADRTLEFGYGLLAFAVGVGLLVLSPRRRANQALAWLLIVDGIGMGGMMAEARSWTWAGASFTHAAEQVANFSFATVPFLYLLFIGHAVPGPVARFLRTRVVLVVLAVATVVHLVFMMGWFGTTPGAPPTAWGVVLFYGPLLGSGLVGLAASVQYARRARPGLEARRARAYLYAFVSRDIGYVAAYSFFMAAQLMGFARRPAVEHGSIIFLQTCWLVFLAFLVYGILTGQVLELDRKFRLGISRTAAAAAVAVLFLVITESVEQIIGVEDPVVAVATAVALALTFRPIQALAERMAGRVLPGGASLSQLDREDRLRLYREQAELAWQDGIVTSAEADMLSRLRTRLGLSRGDVGRLEADTLPGRRQAAD